MSRYHPLTVTIDGKLFTSLARYQAGGKTWHQFLPTPEQQKRMEEIVGWSLEAERRRDVSGVNAVVAESIAINLTPEGIDPSEKDVQEILAEVWSLPYRFITEAEAEIPAVLFSFRESVVN